LLELYLFLLYTYSSCLITHLGLSNVTVSKRDSPNSPGSDTKFGNDLDLSHVEKVDRGEGRFDIGPAIDRRVARKFDNHIIPWLFAIWYVNGMRLLKAEQRLTC
jgi:hypothetical protein